MLDWLKNTFFNQNRYKTHKDAVIIACFFNPENSPYRILAFQKWYRSIKHLNHLIIECLIGEQTKSQLPESPHIIRTRADSLLFHKESLLNLAVTLLPRKYKYVFWVDADVLFTNQNWLVDGVESLQSCPLVQLFSWCVHLDKYQIQPAFNLETAKDCASNLEQRNPKVWRSFAYTYNTTSLGTSENYDLHGHVGFAWGARREVLDNCLLYEKALVGGADHILAHACVGQIPHPCIQKGFADNLNEVIDWSKKFYKASKGWLGYVHGDLYHLWHGEIKNRRYLKRIQDFTGSTKKLTKDKKGFYRASGSSAAYVKNYYRQREVRHVPSGDINELYDTFYNATEFIEDMGYALIDFIQYFQESNNSTDGSIPDGTVVDQIMTTPDITPIEPADTQPSEPGPCGLFTTEDNFS